MIFANALLALQLLSNRPVPATTPLQVRLTSAVSSYASKAGDPVSADLIVPVTWNGEIVLPAGSRLTGTVRSIQRVGYGLIHESAALDLELNRIHLPSGEELPVSARVQAVDTGRERVTRDGSIRGVRKTSSLAYRFSGYVRTAIAWEMHAELALWAVKMLLVQVPEPELYYPEGVELTLRLAKPLLVPALETVTEPPFALSGDERKSLEPMVANLPERAFDPKLGLPSDVINIMLVGAQEDLVEAFTAAGWTRPERRTWGSGIRQIRAVAEMSGNRSAPMTNLVVNGSPADMSWQKGFNDQSKRHHIRLWKQAETWQANEIWVGAATRDIDFAFLRPGHALTHKIESNVDLEREKIVNDLVYTGCVDQLDSFRRPGVPVYTRNATGDAMVTDARLAVLRINRCDAPKGFAANISSLPPHGNTLQRLLRREILTFRNDMLRENIYWRSYEGVRWGVTKLHDQAALRREKVPAIDHELARPAPAVEIAAARRYRGRVFTDLLR